MKSSKFRDTLERISPEQKESAQKLVDFLENGEIYKGWHLFWDNVNQMIGAIPCDAENWRDKACFNTVDEAKKWIDERTRSEQLCRHQYKAIYLGMGYVRQCIHCGDVQQ